MESQYFEHLVKCNVPILVKIARILSIAGEILFALLVPVSPVMGIAGCILMAAAFWFINREAGKEYEYIYVDGDISFDTIYNRSKRKTQCKTSWEEIKLVCKAGSPELEGYCQKNAPLRNYTSHDGNFQDVYALVTEKSGTPMVIYFEPAPEMLEMMCKKAPFKVKQ
jgi:hypothetical protein